MPKNEPQGVGGECVVQIYVHKHGQASVNIFVLFATLANAHFESCKRYKDEGHKRYRAAWQWPLTFSMTCIDCIDINSDSSERHTAASHLNQEKNS